MVSLAIIIHLFMGYCTCSTSLFKQQVSFYFLFLIIEDYEKLKTKVAKILEEKTQVEEKKQTITS